MLGKRSADETRQEIQTFLISVGVTGVGFLVFFLLRYAVGRWFPRHPFLGEMITHIAVGFLVAGIIIVALEFNAHRLLHRQVHGFLESVSKNVFQALLERIVPKEIFEEMNDILRGKVIRKNCEYVITFAKHYPDMPRDYFVIRRILTFTVENLLNEPTDFPVRSIYSGSEDLASAAWMGRQYHLKLMVDNQQVEIKKGKNLLVRNGLTVLHHPVHLGSKGSAEVFLQSEEPCRIDASRNSYIQGTPAIGIRVNIHNELPDVIEILSVQMNHPARELMKTTPELGRYVLDRAFLPGQGFEIAWKTLPSVGAKESGSVTPAPGS
ncbi:MAG TPA: hypothetical protein VOA87_01045 [Thermoanaerobaculia bacterium]|nr:hypothetical protein [Thermoanaerobaculia bacterium]